MKETKNDTSTKNFADHIVLAMRYLRWNGSKGTEKQALKLMGQLSYETLKRMCEERGIQ